MSWLSTTFNSAGVNVIASVGNVIDDLVSSDKEVALTDIQKSKIKAAYNVNIQELMTALDQQAARQEKYQGTKTPEGHELDMKSDSWLSKNIRPMALIFMSVVVAILAFYTTFNATLSAVQLNTLKIWVPFFQIIMITIYAFYFGSRGMEKIQKIRASQPTENESNKTLLPQEQEPRG